MITKPRQKAKNILPVAQDIWGHPLGIQDRGFQGLCSGHPCFCNLLGSCGKGPSHQYYNGFWLLSTLSQTERRLSQQQASLILCLLSMLLGSILPL